MPNQLLVLPAESNTAPAAPAPPHGLELAPLAAADVSEVGRAYWESFGGADAETTLDEATDDVRLALDGGYGAFLPGASFSARVATGAVVGAVLTVRDAPWPDVPRGPFVIDLFVVPAYRRRGIARALVQTTTAAVAGEAVGLRVENDNGAALALYASLGFRPHPGV